MSYPRDMDDIAQEIYENAKDHGFWAGPENDNIPTKLMLIVSELAEALEDYRNGRMEIIRVFTQSPRVARYEATDSSARYWDAEGNELTPKDAFVDKPDGFPIELADAVIRIFDLSARLGINIDQAVREKMAYNRLRPHMHGGRRV